MNLLQEYVRALLTEGAKRVEDLPSDVFVAIDVTPKTLGAELVYEDWIPTSEEKEIDAWGDVAAIKIGRGRREGGRVSPVPVWARPMGLSLGAFSIFGSSASHGWGPLLYDVVMELAYEKDAGLTPDRGGVTSKARNIWHYYLNNRPDIRIEQLDFEPEYFYHTTPDDPSDDSRMQPKERNDLYNDDPKVHKAAQKAYLAGPMSKVYYSNGTPTLDKLRAAGKLLE